MSLADRIASADPSGSFIYLKANGTPENPGQPAQYVVEIEGRKADGTGGVRDEAGKFKGVPAFIAYFTIIESNNPERPAGTPGVSWYQGSDKTGFDGRVRAFFNAVYPDLAKASKPQFAEAYESAVGPTQTLAGLRVRARVTWEKARLTGRNIEAVTWEPYEGE